VNPDDAPDNPCPVCLGREEGNTCCPPDATVDLSMPTDAPEDTALNTYDRMMTSARLTDLAKLWDVTLTTKGWPRAVAEWYLTLWHFERGSYEYHGTDLARVVRAALAGKPTGRVS